jgi:hypothetical protein
MIQYRSPLSHDFRLPADVRERYRKQRDAEHQRSQAELVTRAGKIAVLGHVAILSAMQIRADIAWRRRRLRSRSNGRARRIAAQS